MKQTNTPETHSVLDALQNQLHAVKNPWLMHLMLKQWQRVLDRMSCFYARLAVLPRRNRRALQRALATSLVGAALLLAMSSAPAIYAAAPTINVDGTTCTLDDAIATANTNSNQGGCTIIAGSGTDTLNLTNNITLSAPLTNQVTTDMIVEGNSHYIDGNSYSIFIVDGSGGAVNFTINQTTLKNAYSSLYGAALYNKHNQGTVNVSQCTITGNAVNINGGAIENYDGTMTITDTTFSGNKASFGRGGALENFNGTLTLSTVTFDNSVAPNDADKGGAISNYGKTSTLTIDTNSVLSGNYAQYYGGAIYSGGDAKTNIYDSTISNNTASNDNGGGISVYHGTLTLHNTTISDNYGYYGGGIDLMGRGTSKIYDSTISGNDHGGGITVQNYGSYYPALFVYSSTISDNTANAPAGGINCYKGDTKLSIYLKDSTISGNKSHGDTGGIDGDYCVMVVVNSTISGNTDWFTDHASTKGGGGVYNYNGSTLLTNSTVSGNSAVNYAGGVSANDGTLRLVNTTVTGNTSANGSAGGFGVYGNAAGYLNRSLISGNSTKSGSGPGNEVHLASGAFAAESAKTHTRDKGTHPVRTKTTETKSGKNMRAQKQSAAPRSGIQPTLPKKRTGMKPTAGATLAANDYNLFGHSGETNAQAFSSNFTPTTPTDITATSDSTNPKSIGGILNTTLALNGSTTTQTHALVVGSPALNQAPNAECAAAVGAPDFGAGGLDQRGETRPGYTLCDIGSFERQPNTAVNVTGVNGRVNKNGDAIIRWKTTTESQIAGFNIYRKYGKRDWKQVNATFKQAKHPGDALGDKYRFADKTVKTGKTYRYKVEVKYLDGHNEWTDAVKIRVP